MANCCRHPIAEQALEPSSFPTPRSRVKRLHERGRYDFDTVAAILDSAFLCHVGYVIDGKPYVTPTSYWREGDHVYWHGSSASRMLRTVAGGVEVCLTVSHIDGLVLARSAFHHSVNYRSVMLFGQAQKVEDPAAKLQALENFVEHMYPGRWKELRPSTTSTQGDHGAAHADRRRRRENANRPADRRRGRAMAGRYGPGSCRCGR